MGPTAIRHLSPMVGDKCQVWEEPFKGPLKIECEQSKKKWEEKKIKTQTLHPYFLHLISQISQCKT